ncbi:MAG: TIM-barrel domain-containing protein [Thermoleophilaceae bacterium]
MGGRRIAVAALAALLALGAPQAAGAAVEIGPEHIVVTDDEGARAVVQRAPFKLSFVDASGGTVLEHVDGALPGAEANVDESVFPVVPENAHYAPLSFQLGVEKATQHPGGLWTGNMLVGVRAGVVHAATEVVDARAAGDRVELEVATTSPAHVLTVTVAPDEGSAFRVRADLPYTEVVAAFQESFRSEEGEAFHGFGGRHNSIDQRGEDFYNWVEEEAFGAGPLQPLVDFIPGAGGDRYLFPNGPHQAYYVQNVFVSSRPYGFMLNQTEVSRWRMAADRPDAWQVAVRADELDYTVAVGDAPTAIRSLTKITGRHPVSPEWAMGPNLKRNVQQGADDPESQRRKIREDIARIQAEGVRVDAYTYESWDSLGDDWVRETNRMLEDLGIRPVGYVRAYVNDDGNFDPEGTFMHAVRSGHCTRTPGGVPFIGVAVGPACLLDFTNPATVHWWERHKIRRQLDLGFHGFMQDFGEQVTEDMRFHDGSIGVEMHNRYPILFHRTTRRILDAYEREHPDRGEIWMYTRSGFSGYADESGVRHPGSQGYESANFPGDETGDWQRSLGLPSLATDMLNRAVGGAYGFTTDIGGYFDSFTSDVLDEELFTRWMEWSALTPFFRLHNSCCTNDTQMPWEFEHGVERWNALSGLHERAVPYMRELWEQAQTTGMPITRPMWLAAPGEPEARAQDQQWMLGDDVLVAPVVEKGAISRRVWFPEGCWRHGETGEERTGPGYHDVAAPLGRLPWFERCGTDPVPGG